MHRSTFISIIASGLLYQACLSTSLPTQSYSAPQESSKVVPRDSLAAPGFGDPVDISITLCGSDCAGYSWTSDGPKYGQQITKNDPNTLFSDVTLSRELRDNEQLDFSTYEGTAAGDPACSKYIGSFKKGVTPTISSFACVQLTRLSP